MCAGVLSAGDNLLMLIKRAVLERIAAGEIDIAFRRWKRPTVAAGGSLRTSVGMLAIDAVDRTSLSAITRADAERAGFDTKAALLRELSARTGDLYRIELRPGGEDPLLTLRAHIDLTTDDVQDLRNRLDRLDRASPRGPWTQLTLELLAENPHVRAEDLAVGLGLDKPTFKNDVRKLKRLGLTISHSPGYELSPRGHAYLECARDET